jgi:hypothetical protein
MIGGHLRAYKYRFMALPVILAMTFVPSAAASVSQRGLPPYLKCSPTKVDELTYRGGLVQPGPQVALIFWGSWWKHDKSAPKAIKELKALFKGLYGSAWADTVTQYCDAFGEFPQTNAYGTMLAATHIDTSNPPRRPTGGQLTHEAAKLIKPPVQGPFVGVVAMIVTPPGVTPSGDGPVGSKTSAQCGHHGWGTAVYKKIDEYYSWADVPYGVISATPVCTQHITALRELSLVAGHEWAEAVTDPYINGPGKPSDLHTAWAATISHHAADEVADLCVPDVTEVNGQTAPSFWLVLRTGRFWMQQLWSNEAGPSKLRGKCVKGS